MRDRAIIVLDIGKTYAKLGLWAWDGGLIARESRANRFDGTTLDAVGIESWLADTLTDFAKRAHVGIIIPVAHGAAAALVCDGVLLCPPRDYEADIPTAVRTAYEALRDPFAETGSPALPQGLNLGAQLYTQRELIRGSQILLWPQYWAWLLSGVAASEVTSLGCHTDLWRPAEARPSDLVRHQGWAEALPPLRRAGDVLGPITPSWVARTGLPRDTRIYCGLHDSNAALVAARGFAEMGGQESTTLSTGTWFVAMRTPAGDTQFNPADLPAGCDCLLNVDVLGQPIPSARWMGGRESEELTGDGVRIDDPEAQADMVAAVADVVQTGGMILPCFAPNFGPFGGMAGSWSHQPQGDIARASRVALYAALVTNESLNLIGARNHILIEGRFAASQVFTRALARLRPCDTIYTSGTENDVSFGALRLVNPMLNPQGKLSKVAALDIDLLPYAQLWRHTVALREGKS